MSVYTMMNRTIRTSSRCAMAAGFLIATVHVGSAYAAVNPDPGGGSSYTGPADLARPAVLSQTVAADYRLARLVVEAQAGSVHHQLTALER